MKEGKKADKNESPEEVINELRAETGYGLMDCKDALEAVKWDINKAKVWLKYRWMPEVDEMEKVKQTVDNKTEVRFCSECGTDARCNPVGCCSQCNADLRTADAHRKNNKKKEKTMYGVLSLDSNDIVFNSRETVRKRFPDNIIFPFTVSTVEQKEE